MFDKIAWIIIVNLALYMKTLRYKFVSDDFSSWKQTEIRTKQIEEGKLPKIGKARILWESFIGNTKYLLPSVHIFRREADKKFYLAVIKTEELEHLFAILLHICICVSIFFAFGANDISFLATLLYSVNPSNNQGTVWPSGRGYALPIFCLTTAMAIPILGPFLLLFCSYFTVGFLAPLALIGSPQWYLLGFMPFIWWWHSRKFTTAVKTKSKAEAFKEDKVIHPRKLILGMKTFGFYLTHCLVPFRITFYHSFLQSAAGSLKHKCYTLCKYFWIGIIALTCMVLYAIMTPWNTLSWAFFAFCITVLPFCNLVRSNQEIAERYKALPNVFLMYALAQILFKIGSLA